MKIVILAGGKGTRMGSLTAEIPKPMVQLAGKPILEHQIALIRRYKFYDISILTGYKGDVIKDYFLDGRNWDTKIEYFPDPKPLGTAGSVKEIEHVISDTFLLLYGDTMIDINLNDLINFHKEKGGIATLVVHPNDHPYDSDLLEINEDNLVTSFYSKPHKEGIYHRNLVNAALYVLSPEIFEFIEKDKFSDFGKDIFPKLMSLNKAVYAYNTTEYIKDVGTIERLKEVENDFLSGKVNRLNKSNKQKAVFIDRDGVINPEAEPLNTSEKFSFLPGVVDAIKLLKKSEYISVVVTNQPMIAKGFASVVQLQKVHNYMEYLLGKEKVFLDRIYYCPHHPEKGFEGERKEYKIDCTCRKPETGMIDNAAIDMNIDLNKSFIIGDRTVDIMTGINANLHTILIRQGYAGKDAKYNCVPDFIFNNLLEATQFIVNGYDKLINNLRDVIGEILVKEKSPIITIGGLSRSGKSTLSSIIKILIENAEKKVNILKLDDWLLSKDERSQDMDVRDRYQYNLIEKDIKNLLLGKKITKNTYKPLSRMVDQNAEVIKYNHGEVLLIDGVVALDNKYIRKISHLNLFTEVSEELRKDRFYAFYRYKSFAEEEINKLYNIRLVDEVSIIVESKQYANQILNMDFSI
jgi:mannose-1-phosphate guanylyltransferase / phosphomannomutase